MTEKNYNPNQKERNAMGKQPKVGIPAEKLPKENIPKQEEKLEDKIEEKSEEKKEVLEGEEPEGVHPSLEDELGLNVAEDDDEETDFDAELEELLNGETEEEPEEE